MPACRRLASLAALLAVLAGPATANAAGPDNPELLAQLTKTYYYVYCPSGKIEVDSRSPEQMRSARGSNTCMLSRFSYLSDAQSFAQKNVGGAGKTCSCRRPALRIEPVGAGFKPAPLFRG